MNTQQRLPRKALLTGLLVMLALTTGLLTHTPAHADGPTDGRVNSGVWANSYGAVAVYCVDATGTPGTSFAGGISVLNATGTVVLWASASQINAVGDTPSQATLVAASPTYQLSRLPNGNFELDSLPDTEGKTFVGAWTATCAAVAP